MAEMSTLFLVRLPEKYQKTHWPFFSTIYFFSKSEKDVTSRIRYSTHYNGRLKLESSAVKVTTPAFQGSFLTMPSRNFGTTNFFDFAIVKRNESRVLLMFQAILRE